MGRAKEPVDLLIAKGKKHLTKAEIEDRRNKEIKVDSENVSPPDYLPEELVDKFNELASELVKAKIMANLDCEALARYIMVEHEFQKVSVKIFKSKSMGDNYLKLLASQDKLFKMARQSSSDLGLNISARCKLVIPKVKEEKPKNKFSKFA